jgi:hypothetical protein
MNFTYFDYKINGMYSIYVALKLHSLLKLILKRSTQNE